MPKRHRYELLPTDESLESLDARSMNSPEHRAELMMELRHLQNTVPTSYFIRDERLRALAISNALSRRDMARATGMAESRINQLIRESAEHDQEMKDAAARELVARHMPPA